MKDGCPFCQIGNGDGSARVILENEAGFVVRDGFPVSPGHSLIISKAHVGSFFDLATATKQELLALLDRAKQNVDFEFSPASYNVGINDGMAAGQTIPHVHIHLIPRYRGDLKDPRGGVRWVIPEKAAYWSQS